MREPASIKDLLATWTCPVTKNGTPLLRDLTGVYPPGVGVVVGAGVADGEATGELSGFGEEDGLAFAVLRFVLAWCLEELVVPLPAFSSVFPVFFNPFPTVRSAACAPCSTVWPVAFAPCSTVWPVFFAAFSTV